MTDAQLQEFFGPNWHIAILVPLFARSGRQSMIDGASPGELDAPDEDGSTLRKRIQQSFPSRATLEYLMDPSAGRSKLYVRTWADVKKCPYELMELIRSGGPADIVEELLNWVLEKSGFDLSGELCMLADHPRDDAPPARFIRTILMQITQPWAPMLLDRIGVKTATLGGGYKRWLTREFPDSSANGHPDDPETRVGHWLTEFVMTFAEGDDLGPWLEEPWAGNTCDEGIPAAILARYPLDRDPPQ